MEHYGGIPECVGERGQSGPSSGIVDVLLDHSIRLLVRFGGRSGCSDRVLECVRVCVCVCVCVCLRKAAELHS